MTVSSRSIANNEAIQALKFLGFETLFDMKMIKYQSKEKHFAEFQQKYPHIKFSEMLMFDDDQNNIDKLKKMGIKCIKVDPAIGLEIDFIISEIQKLNARTTEKLNKTNQKDTKPILYISTKLRKEEVAKMFENENAIVGDSIKWSPPFFQYPVFFYCGPDSANSAFLKYSKANSTYKIWRSKELSDYIKSSKK